MSTSNNQLATRHSQPATQLAANAMPRRGTLDRPNDRPSDRPSDRPGDRPAQPTVGRLPVPAQPLRLVVDHDGMVADAAAVAPIISVKQVSSSMRRAGPSGMVKSGMIKAGTSKSASRKSVLKAAATPESSLANAKLSARVSSRVTSAIGTVIGAALGRSKKTKSPQSPLVCLGPGGEFATAYVGERDGSLTATDPEQFSGIAGTDRAQHAAGPHSATESERALLAIAAIGAATAARLKAQMAAVYRLASLCRAAMSCVVSLSPIRNGAGATARTAKSGQNRKVRQARQVRQSRQSRRSPASSVDGLFTAAASNQSGTAEPTVGSKVSAATVARTSTSIPRANAPAPAATASPTASATAVATSSRASTPAARPATGSSQRSKSRPTGVARSKGVPQSSFSTAATQPLLPLAQEVAA